MCSFIFLFVLLEFNIFLFDHNFQYVVINVPMILLPRGRQLYPTDGAGNGFLFNKTAVFAAV